MSNVANLSLSLKLLTRSVCIGDHVCAMPGNVSRGREISYRMQGGWSNKCLTVLERHLVAAACKNHRKLKISQCSSESP